MFVFNAHNFSQNCSNSLLFNFALVKIKILICTDAQIDVPKEVLAKFFSVLSTWKLG